MIEESEKLYTLQEVADILKVSRQTVYNHVTAKRLRAYRPGGQRDYRVTNEDLQDFIRQGSNMDT